jgi:putative membrane protein
VTRAAAVLALAGLALATVLVVHEGAGTVLAALAAAGAAGLVWSSLFHVVPMALNARAWQQLLRRGPGRSLPFLSWLVWVREAVDSLLPVARVGGEVAAARLMVRRGIPAAPAVASLVADITVALGTQALFTLVGVVLLAGRGSSGAMVRTAWLSLVASLPVIAAVALVQRAGAGEALGRVARKLAGRHLGPLVGEGRRTDRVLRVVYRGGRMLRCAGWQLLAWTGGAVEIWIFMSFLGPGIPFPDAVIIESLVQAVSSAFFVVPGALGVQEGAFLAVGGAVGLAPDAALALALARRARDLMLFVPALVAWQGQEGRRLFTARG